jgi:acetylglutamate kinase
LKAEKLIMLTDVEGIFEDYQDKGSLISALKVERAYRMINQGQIEGGMIPKVQACITALKAGVNRTHIIDGRQLHSMLLEILTDKGIGTMVVE